MDISQIPKKLNKELIERFFGHLAPDIGIDLGTANTLVYVKGRGIVINEPSVVAINQRTGQILAIGREAKKMVGKTPSHIVATRPLVDGVVSDFEVTQQMLRYFIHKVNQGRFSFLRRPRVLIGIPSGVTEVEKRAVIEAAPGIGDDWQAGVLQCSDDFLGRLATAGGRVAHFVQLVGKTPEVVDGFWPLGKADCRHGGIPVGADNHNGARQRQRFGHGRQRSTGSTGT